MCIRGFPSSAFGSHRDTDVRAFRLFAPKLRRFLLKHLLDYITLSPSYQQFQVKYIAVFSFNPALAAALLKTFRETESFPLTASFYRAKIPNKIESYESNTEGIFSPMKRFSFGSAYAYSYYFYFTAGK